MWLSLIHILRPLPSDRSKSNVLLFGLFFKVTPETASLFSKMLYIMLRNCFALSSRKIADIIIHARKLPVNGYLAERKNSLLYGLKIPIYA